MPLRFLLLVGLLILASLLFPSGVHAGSLPKITFDEERDTAYLPYAVTAKLLLEDVGRRAPIIHAATAVQPCTPDYPNGSYLFLFNHDSLVEDLGAHFNWNRYPERSLIAEGNIAGDVVDIAGVLSADSLIVVYSAFARDTAWLVRLDLPGGGRESLFVATGTDQTGDHEWHGLFGHVLTSDYDFDGHPEVFFNLNTVKDMGDRILICVDPITFTCEWKLALASSIANIIDCHDSLDPGVIVATQTPGQGVKNSLFSDEHGYTIRLNRNGVPVFTKVTTTYPWGNGLTPGIHPGTFFVGYQSDATSSPSEKVGIHIVCFDYHGKQIGEWVGPNVLAGQWTADYDGDGLDEMFVADSQGGITILSDSLVPIAQGSLSNNPGYLGRLERFDGKHDVQVIVESNDRVGLYDGSFRKLAQIPNCRNFTVLRRGEAGQVLELLTNSSVGDSYVVSFEKQDFWRQAAIFYRRNQVYVLTAMFALLSGLLVSNFYRSQARRNVATISRQRADLEKAHEALKDAQQQIIAQEKFRQAKDIAGGFAHEIRNALFPADSSITKLQMQAKSGTIDAELVTRHLSKVSSAITRAVDITELISSYTKLDTLQNPEETRIGAVVQEVIEANRARIEQAGVKIGCDGDPAMSAWSNHKQLYIVINNLVLNSLDALESRTEGSIRISWERQQEMIRMFVADNGCGMDSDVVVRIFDAFYSTKPYRGTGLGLTISRKIVELYGGTMMVQSEPGAGTTFEIMLKSCSR